MTRRAGGRRVTVLAVVGTACVVGSLAVGGAATAAFAPVPSTGVPGQLVLRADPYPLLVDDLEPGVPAHWVVEASLEDADQAELALQLRRSGALAADLTVSVAECGTVWLDVATAPSCASGATSVLTATPADDFDAAGPSAPLDVLDAGSPRYLLVTLALPAGSDPAGRDATIGIGLTATQVSAAHGGSAPPHPEEDVEDPPAAIVPVTAPAAEHLSDTGVAYVAAAALLAAGLLVVGAAARLARGSRRSRA